MTGRRAGELKCKPAKPALKKLHTCVHITVHTLSWGPQQHSGPEFLGSVPQQYSGGSRESRDEVEEARESGVGAEFEEAVNIGLRVWMEHPHAPAAYYAAWIHWLPHMVSIRHKSAAVGGDASAEGFCLGRNRSRRARNFAASFFYSSSFSSLQRGRWRRRSDAAASRGRPPCASCGRTALCASPSTAPRGRCPTRCPARPAPPAPRR